MIYQGKARYQVRGVVLHCTGVNNAAVWRHKRPFEVFTSINRAHHERGFVNGFGYHALIMPDGQLFAGRPLDMIGAHCIEANRGSLGLLLVETKTIDGITMFQDWFTDAQRIAAQEWIADKPGIEWVKGHNDFTSKLCPGFHVYGPEWLSGPRQLRGAL